MTGKPEKPKPSKALQKALDAVGPEAMPLVNPEIFNASLQAGVLALEAEKLGGKDAKAAVLEGERIATELIHVWFEEVRND